MLDAIRLDLRAGRREQRADEAERLEIRDWNLQSPIPDLYFRKHSPQPSHPRAAQKVHQYRLSLIVGGVGDGDDLSANGVREACEEGIAESARGFLDRLLVREGVSARRSGFGMEREAALLSLDAHKPGISRSLGAETVVQVGHMNCEFPRGREDVKQVEQAQTVRAAGNA